MHSLRRTASQVLHTYSTPSLKEKAPECQGASLQLYNLGGVSHHLKKGSRAFKSDIYGEEISEAGIGSFL